MSNEIEFEYFYEEQSEQFTFYKMPKLFFTDEILMKISTDSKVLYGLLLDRVSLSSKNRWFDDSGRVYIIYTLENIQKSLGCGDKKASRLLLELEEYGLIEKKKQGQGKPSVIYVKNFILPSKQRFKNGQNNDSRKVKTTSLDSSKQRCSYTDIKDTDYSNTDLIISSDSDIDEMESYREYFMDHLGIEALKWDYPYESEIIDGILELILDVVWSNRLNIRIAGEEKSIKVVKNRFMKLDYSHIKYVLKCMKENTSKVRSIKQYLLAAIYNAPVTKGSFYQSLVNNDIATGKL